MTSVKHNSSRHPARIDRKPRQAAPDASPPAASGSAAPPTEALTPASPAADSRPSAAAGRSSPEASGITIKVKMPDRRTMHVISEFQEAAEEGAPLETFLAVLCIQKRIPDALRLLEHLESGDKDNAMGLEIWRAAILAAAGRREAAREAMQSRGPATWGKYFEASLFLGMQYPQARLWLAEQAVQLEGHAAPLLARMGLLQHELGEVEAALSTFARLAELEDLDEVCREARMDCQLRTGRWHAARAEVEARVAACPEARRFKLMLAAVLAEAGECEAARVLCLQADDKVPVTPAEMRWFIHAACKIGDTDLLVDCYRHMVRQGRVEGDGFAVLINAHARRGELKAALRVAILATRAPGADAQAHRTLGELLDAQGERAAAAQAYAAAMERDKSDVSLALLHAEALLAGRDLKAAGAAFRAILVREPHLMPALRGMVAVLKERNAAPRDMVETLHRAHVRQPDDIALAQDFVAAALAPVNRTWRRRALGTLERLHAQDPDAPLWRTLLARALRATDPERALRLVQDVLDTTPDHHEAITLREAARATLQQRQDKLDFALKTIPLPGASTRVPPPRPITFTDLAQQVTGIEVGKTHENRVAVRTADGQLVWAPWSVCGESQSIGAVAALKAGAAYAVPEGIAKRFEEVLAANVLEGASVLDFCRAIGKRGEAFLSGGAVRDIINDPKNAAPRDHDLAVTIAPSLVRLCCGSLTGNAPGLKDRPNGVVSAYPLEFFGLVKYGTIEAGVVHASLDVMSVRTFGAYEPVQQVRGARQLVKPVAFGPDLHADALFRDFTCNALYYVPATRTLLDPLGVGKADAVQQRLQLCSFCHIHSNESLGWRYLKMRLKGYTPTERTREAMRSHFAHYLARSDAAAWLSRSLFRVFADLGESADRAVWFATAARLLEGDAVGDAALPKALARALGLPPAGDV